MAKRKGTDILLGYLNGSTFTQFAGAKSCDYEMEMELQEVSSPTTGKAREYIPKRYGWTMQCQCLLCDDNETIETAFRNGTALTVVWKDNSTGGTRETLTGTAYIKSLKAGATIHQMGTFAISLQGSGELARTVAS